MKLKNIFLGILSLTSSIVITKHLEVSETSKIKELIKKEPFLIIFAYTQSNKVSKFVDKKLKNIGKVFANRHKGKKLTTVMMLSDSKQSNLHKDDYPQMHFYAKSKKIFSGNAPIAKMIKAKKIFRLIEEKFQLKSAGGALNLEIESEENLNIPANIEEINIEAETVEVKPSHSTTQQSQKTNASSGRKRPKKRDHY